MGSGTDAMKTKSTPPAKNDEAKSSSTDDTSKIEADIEKTRASMSDTIDQLHGKLNPSVLKDQALDQFQQAKEAIKSDLRNEIDEVKRHLGQELAQAKSEFREATIGKVEHMVDDAQQTVTETSNTLMAVVRDNPIPAALIGLGIGWLFINARARGGARRGNQRYMNASYTSTGRRTVEGYAGQLGERANRVAHQATDRAGSLLHSAEDRAGSLLHSAQDRAGSLLHDAGDRAGTLAHSAQDQAKKALDQATEGVQSFARDASGSVNEYAGRAKSTALAAAHDARDTAVQWEGTVERTLRENPLPVGAIALALGLAAGLAIPATRMEDQWVGEYRDRALDEAEVLAEQALGTIESGAKKLVENAKSTDQHHA